jgi:type VI secretion system VgrG family protein
VKHQVTVRIESPAFDADAVRIVEITGTETISQMFEMTLHLAATDPGALDEEKLLTSPVELVFERTDDKTLVMTEERRIGGMISALRDRFLTESEHREVIATFVPRAWQTSLTKTTDIFMDMTIPEIVKKKLETGAGLADADVEMRLKQTYPKREFVVQYKESDLAFISRLTEDLGIHFFFERKKDKDVLVFGDENAAFLPSTPEAAPFMKRGEDVGVHRLESVRHRIPKVFKARDYNYRNPALDLVGEAQTKGMGSAGSVDEFGPHAKTSEEAVYYAQLRAEEAGARHRIYEGRSDLPGIRAGSLLKVEGHPGGELALVVVEVRHEGRQAAFNATVDDAGYHNTFKAIAESVTFRPARVTPKPVVHGVVTGIVQTEAATNFGAIDAEGRYRVSFMYDTVTGRGDGKASRPLRMAQPSAGAERGFHQPLKVGTEVIITCLNGDPDRPIISGAVPNPQTPSPVTSANAEKSMWKTNVSQMAFDDDKPRMKMTVSGEDHLFQIGEPNGPEFGFMTGTVGNATSMVEGVNTTHASIKSAWDGWKNDFASDDILNAAGVPNPWAKWKKWEAVAQAAVDTIKTASSLLDNAAQLADGDLKKAKQAKEDADEAKTKADAAKAVTDKALAAALKNAKVDDEALEPQMTVETVADPANPPQTKQIVKTETRAQALERAAGPAAANDPALKKAIDDANNADKAAKEAADTAETEAADLKAAEEGKDERYIPGEVITGVGAAIGNPLVIAAGVAGGDVTVGGLKEVAKFVDETHQKLKSLQEKAANLVKLASIIPGGPKLISFLSGKLGKIAHKAIDKTTAGYQLMAGIHAGRSGQRTKADCGKFDSPHNIQFGRHSASIHGGANAIVFGMNTAVLHSRDHASVIGNKCVNIKSSTQCEMAAPIVRVTGKADVDIQAAKTVRLVADALPASGAAVHIPAGNTMYLRSKEGIMLETLDKDVTVDAKKNIKLHAKEESFELRAQKKVKIDAETEDFKIFAKKNFEVLTPEGKVTVRADDGAIALLGKKEVLLKSSKNNVNVRADDGKITLSASKEVEVKCKDAKIKASGPVKVKGSKIHLS